MSIVGLVAELHTVFAAEGSGDGGRGGADSEMSPPDEAGCRGAGRPWKEAFTRLLQLPSEEEEGAPTVAAAAYRLRRAGQMEDADALESLIDQITDRCATEHATLLRCLLHLQRQPRQTKKSIMATGAPATKPALGTDLEGGLQAVAHCLEPLLPALPGTQLSAPLSAGAQSWQQDALLQSVRATSVFCSSRASRNRLIPLPQFPDDDLQRPAAPPMRMHAESTLGSAHARGAGQALGGGSSAAIARLVSPAEAAGCASTGSGTKPSPARESRWCARRERLCWETAWAQDAEVLERVQVPVHWHPSRQAYSPASYFSAEAVAAFERICDDNDAEETHLASGNRTAAQVNPALALAKTVHAAEMYRACSMVLQGFQCNLFSFSTGRETFRWAATDGQPIRASSSSRKMLSSMMGRFSETGTHCARIEKLCTETLVRSEPCGVVERNFASTLSRYLQRIRSSIYDLSAGPRQTPLCIFQSTRYLRHHVSKLGVLAGCILGGSRKHSLSGLRLLNKLYVLACDSQAGSKVPSPNQTEWSNITSILFSEALRPFVGFVEKWMFHGQFCDPFAEFLDRQPDSVLLADGECSPGSVRPKFLSAATWSMVLRCGAGVRLLRQHDPTHYLPALASRENPAIRTAGLLPRLADLGFLEHQYTVIQNRLHICKRWRDTWSDAVTASASKASLLADLRIRVSNESGRIAAMQRKARLEARSAMLIAARESKKAEQRQYRAQLGAQIESNKKLDDERQKEAADAIESNRKVEDGLVAEAERLLEFEYSQKMLAVDLKIDTVKWQQRRFELQEKRISFLQSRQSVETKALEEEEEEKVDLPPLPNFVFFPAAFSPQMWGQHAQLN